jgi:purine-binding chemotaxis protein CheW
VTHEADIVLEPDTDENGEYTLVDEVVAFFLGGQRYALPIERVQEIQQIVALSEVPEIDEAVVGMVNLRGEVIPVVDGRRLIGLPVEPYTLETPMVICHYEGKLVALVVDEVQDVLGLPAGCLQDAPLYTPCRRR